MILDVLAETARERVAEAKKTLPPEQVREAALKRRAAEPEKDFLFEKALRRPDGDVAFICEVKKASPSKGLIAEDFPYLQIAEDYEKAGASAISVLTEPSKFLGDLKYLDEIAAKVNIPVLRKDFTVDEYMIYEAKAAGASAVLLICAILDTETIRRYLEVADSLGVSAIVEAHDADEVQMALEAGARIVGVNNRDLRDFTVDVTTSIRLRQMVPRSIIFVSESGIKTPSDIAGLRENGTDAVLIGETLMRAADKGALLRELSGRGK